MDEMDMDDKTAWMTDMNNSKTIGHHGVNNGYWNKEQRSSGSRDAVWMTKLVRHMKSGTTEE